MSCIVCSNDYRVAFQQQIRAIFAVADWAAEEAAVLGFFDGEQKISVAAIVLHGWQVRIYVSTPDTNSAGLGARLDARCCFEHLLPNVAFRPGGGSGVGLLGRGRGFSDSFRTFLTMYAGMLEAGRQRMGSVMSQKWEL